MLGGLRRRLGLAAVPVAAPMDRQAAQALVETAYRAVFRHPVHPGGAQGYVAALERGEIDAAEMLRRFMRGAEFRNPVWTDAVAAYDIARDPRLAPFRTAEIEAATAALRASRPIDPARFEALFTAAFGAPAPGGRDYPNYHRLRYKELFNVAAYLLADKPAPRVLDFGACQFTPWWPALIPGVQLTVADRPAVTPTPEAQAFVAVDLNREPMPGPDRLGRFDLVVFTEVLEHLERNAVELIAGLLNLLAPDGRLYLTTPNLFRAQVLALVADRRNPRAPFPASNADGHYHVREYAMSELLAAVDQAGGAVRAWGFSDCWDDHPLPEEELGNLFVLAGRRAAGEPGVLAGQDGAAALEGVASPNWRVTAILDYVEGPPEPAES